MNSFLVDGPLITLQKLTILNELVGGSWISVVGYTLIAVIGGIYVGELRDLFQPWEDRGNMAFSYKINCKEGGLFEKWREEVNNLCWVENYEPFQYKSI